MGKRLPRKLTVNFNVRVQLLNPYSSNFSIFTHCHFQQYILAIALYKLIPGRLSLSVVGHLPNCLVLSGIFYFMASDLLPECREGWKYKLAVKKL